MSALQRPEGAVSRSMATPIKQMEESTSKKKVRLQDSPVSHEEKNWDSSAIDVELPASSSSQPLELVSSEEENGDSSSSSSEEEEEEEEGDEDNDMKTQVKAFFAELSLEEGKQRKRLMQEGVHIPRLKTRLPSHLHSVMGNANLRLARGDTGAAIELCMEIIRQGRVNPFT